MYLFGRKFTLRTDHKPLLKIFAPDSATPVLAAARLQRWSLLLSSYQYEIELKSSVEVANADALSRLPLKYKEDASVKENIFHVASWQLNKHPVSAQEIAREAARNVILAKAVSLTENGWSINCCTDPELKPYFRHRHELLVEQGYLMWGLRVIIPPTLQQPILSELHKAHHGVARMKAMAHSHVWWPGRGLDVDTARRCQTVYQNKESSPSCTFVSVVMTHNSLAAHKQTLPHIKPITTLSLLMHTQGGLRLSVQGRPSTWRQQQPPCAARYGLQLKLSATTDHPFSLLDMKSSSDKTTYSRY